MTTTNKATEKANPQTTPDTTPDDAAVNYPTVFAKATTGVLQERRRILVETRDLCVQNLTSLNTLIATLDTELQVRPESA